MSDSTDDYINRSFLASSFVYIAAIIAALYCSYCRVQRQKIRQRLQQQQQLRGSRHQHGHGESSSTSTSNPRTAATNAIQQRNEDVIREAIFETKRDRLDVFPSHIAFAFAMRVLWLYLTVFAKKEAGTTGSSTNSGWSSGSFRSEDGFLALRNFTSDGGDECQRHSGVSALNRFSQLIYFLAFSTVLTFWSESLYFYHMQQRSMQSDLSNALSRSTVNQFVAPTSNAADNSLSYRQHEHGLFSLMRSPRSLFLIFNFWALIVVIILHLVQFFDAALCDTFHEIETVAISAFFVVLAFGFLAIGLRIRHELLILQKQQYYHKVAKIIWRTTIITSVCSITFICRATLFLVRPIFGYEFRGLLGDILYPWFFYQIPEIVPSAVVLYFMTPRWKYTYIHEPSSSDALQPSGTQHASRISGYGSSDNAEANSATTPLNSAWT